jgi:hypothetical protein
MSKSSLAVITSELSHLPRHLPRHLRGARKSVVELQRQTLKMTKRSPGRTLLGAFAAGFVISRLAKLVLV